MKRIEKPVDVEVRVNPSCELYFKGERWGAGAEIRLPFEVAIAKAKDGVVTILVNMKEIVKEATHGGAE